MRVSVLYSPTELERVQIRNSTVVAIDCFRASTSIVAALAAGAKAVYPLSGVADARREARRRKESVLAGERGGARIRGFDLGNSPREFTAKAVGGRDVVLTTTNGTRLLTAARKASRVFVGAFVNAAVTAAAVVETGKDVVLACVGTEGFFSIEDALCAGMMVDRICRAAAARCDESAQFARAAYRGASNHFGKAALSGRGAANVRALGLDEDLDFCLRVDAFPIVAAAVLRPLRIVRT